MADQILKIISTKPNYVPSDFLLASLDKLLSDNSGRFQEYQIKKIDQIEFIHPAQNLESIKCPICRHPIDEKWWSDQMSEKHKGKFEDLNITLPCCGQPSNLNDLDYHFPAGFARFVIEIWNPENDLVERLLLEVEAILESKFKVIHARY